MNNKGLLTALMEGKMIFKTDNPYQKISLMGDSLVNQNGEKVEMLDLNGWAVEKVYSWSGAEQLMKQGVEMYGKAEFFKLKYKINNGLLMFSDNGINWETSHRSFNDLSELIWTRA